MYLGGLLASQPAPSLCLSDSTHPPLCLAASVSRHRQILTAMLYMAISLELLYDLPLWQLNWVGEGEPSYQPSSLKHQFLSLVYCSNSSLFVVYQSLPLYYCNVSMQLPHMCVSIEVLFHRVCFLLLVMVASPATAGSTWHTLIYRPWHQGP